MMDLIIARAKELNHQVIQWRRDFHAHPELKWEEFRTSKIVEEELRKSGYEVIRVAETGIIGVLRGELDGNAVFALRADMDALPVQEENDVPYRSRVPGKMHACGHDAHTAMLLGAAKILTEIKNKIPGTIKLIFQPAEEGGLGAKKMLESGELDDVDAFFGIHVWDRLPSGVVGIKEGPVMAGADAFRIVVRGKGGHGAVPHFAIDPIPVAADIISALHRIIPREVPPHKPAVLSITKLRAGTASNIIPEEVEMAGTLRTFDEEIREYIVSRMKDVIEYYAKAGRCSASLTFSEEHIPPTVNHPKMTALVKEVASAIAEVVEAKPTMGAEDFAFYAKKAPSAYAFLGIRNEEKGTVYPHHHPRFDVDEDVLWIGTALHVAVALRYLGTELNSRKQ